MADIALDPDGLRRDRQRYFGLLERAEQQIAAWNERADHLQQAIDGLDRLLALAGDDPAQDAGMPRSRTPGRGVAPLPRAAGADPPNSSAEPDKPRTRAGSGKRAGPRHAAAKPPAGPTGTPAAPEPVAPPTGSAAEGPRGTDALRVVFESTPDKAWSLTELIDALEARGWLPPSRRPEEGVRISLKRLAERGGVVRTDEGHWRLAGSEPRPEPDRPEETWPSAPEAAGPVAPTAQAAPAAEQTALEVPSAPEATPQQPLPASFGWPVGGRVTEI